MVFILFKEPRYIWSIISLKISNICRIGIGVALIVLFIESALKVRLLTVVGRRVISRLVRVHIELLGQPSIATTGTRVITKGRVY
jgi:hypothetical protein